MGLPALLAASPLALVDVPGGTVAGSLSGAVARSTPPSGAAGTSPSTASPSSSLVVNRAVVVSFGGVGTRFAGAVASASLGRVTSQAANIAEAFSECGGCASDAIALQVVLAVRLPGHRYDVTNRAIAWNRSCMGCTTFAGAGQLVVWSDVPLVVEPPGLSALAALGTMLRHERWQGCSPVRARQRFAGALEAAAQVLTYELAVAPGAFSGVARPRAVAPLDALTSAVSRAGVAAGGGSAPHQLALPGAGVVIVPHVSIATGTP